MSPMRAYLLLALVLFGCENSAKERVKLAELEKQVEQKVAKAEREGKEKLAETQKQLETLKAELADAKSKVEQATKAQGASEDASKQADAALAKARQAYKTLGKYELVELTKDVKEISAKSAKAKPAVKAAVTKLMEQVPAQQKAIAKDISELEGATLETLDTLKAKLDKDVAALRATLRTARAKVP